MSRQPVSIAILVYPETSASVVYGMYDLFASAGRDWGIVTDGAPGPELLRPMLVAREKGAVNVSNGVELKAETDLAGCADVEVICVPEVNLPPAAPLQERFVPEVTWLDLSLYLIARTTSVEEAMRVARIHLIDWHHVGRTTVRSSREHAPGG